MEIEFRGQYTKSIYFQAIRWIYRPSKKSLITRVAVFVLFGSLYITMVVTAFQEEGMSAYETSRIFRHLITFLLLGYVLFQPAISAYRKANELWGDPIVRRNIAGRVSSLGVIIEPIKDWMLWESFIKTHKTSEHIVMLTASRTFVLLQRSFFKDGQDWKLLQSMVTQKVQEVIE